MYDFYFGTPEAIQADEPKFLLSIKRMLPRWCNSIPDSEFLAIRALLEEHAGRPGPVLVETGVGASTIVLAHHAIKYDGVLLSWDYAAPKAAYMRGVIQDTLLQHYRRNLFDHWRHVPFDTLSPHLGLPVLPQLVDTVNFCFLDSEHTMERVLGEVSAINPLLSEGALVALDDANYEFRHTNFAYINVQRRKLGLADLESPPENRCRPMHEEMRSYLEQHWARVAHLPDTYKATYRSDLFFGYYEAERATMNELGMERLADLSHRFDVWQVQGRTVLVPDREPEVDR